MHRTCPECNHDCLASSSFCTMCGYRFDTKTCPICNLDNVIEAKFCMKCGTKFVSEVKPGPVPTWGLPASEPSMYQGPPVMPPSPRKMDIMTILKHSWSIFRGDLKFYLQMGLIPSISHVVISSVIIMAIWMFFPGTTDSGNLSIVVIAINGVIFLIIYSFTRAGIVHATDMSFREQIIRKTSFSSTIAAVRSKIKTLITADLFLATLSIIVSVFSIQITNTLLLDFTNFSYPNFDYTSPPDFSYLQDMINLLFFSFFLMILSFTMLFLTIMLSFLPHLIVLENQSTLEAMSSAYKRTKSHFLIILGIMIVIGFANMIFAVPAFFTMMLPHFSPIYEILNYIVMPGLIAAFITPFLLIALTVIYHDSIRYAREKP